MNKLDHIRVYSRGYLSHVDVRNGRYSVTLCLPDAIPMPVVRRWALQLQHLSPSERELEWRRRAHAHLDAGEGACWLADSRIAELVQSALLHFDRERYELHAWAIMPNHVHVLLDLLEDFRLQQVVTSWKVFTGRRANRLLGREGRFWQREFYETLIETERHFDEAVCYIEANPVRAHLCDGTDQWPWSSSGWRATAGPSKGRPAHR